MQVVEDIGVLGNMQRRGKMGSCCGTALKMCCKPCGVLFEAPVARTIALLFRITLPQYLKGAHVGVSIFSGSQTIPDQRLAAQGLARNCVCSVPDFFVAMRMVEGTELIATVPKRLAVCDPANPRVRIHSAPKPLFTFKYMMIWHPRMESDPAHAWLRDAVRRATKDLCERKR